MEIPADNASAGLDENAFGQWLEGMPPEELRNTELSAEAKRFLAFLPPEDAPKHLNSASNEKERLWEDWVLLNSYVEQIGEDGKLREHPNHIKVGDVLVRTEATLVRQAEVEQLPGIKLVLKRSTMTNTPCANWRWMREVFMQWFAYYLKLAPKVRRAGQINPSDFKGGPAGDWLWNWTLMEEVPDVHAKVIGYQTDGVPEPQTMKLLIAAIEASLLFGMSHNDLHPGYALQNGSRSSLARVLICFLVLSIC